jgi:hypothetical protein
MASSAGLTRVKIGCPMDADCLWTAEINTTLVESPNPDQDGSLQVRILLSEDDKKQMNDAVRDHLWDTHGIVMP